MTSLTWRYSTQISHQLHAQQTALTPRYPPPTMALLYTHIPAPPVLLSLLALLYTHIPAPPVLLSLLAHTHIPALPVLHSLLAHPLLLHKALQVFLLQYRHYTDCPTVPILSGQYRFEGLCPESRLYLSRDNECPAIGVLEYTCSTISRDCSNY